MCHPGNAHGFLLLTKGSQFTCTGHLIHHLVNPCFFAVLSLCFVGAQRDAAPLLSANFELLDKHCARQLNGLFYVSHMRHTRYNFVCLSGKVARSLYWMKLYAIVL